MSKGITTMDITPQVSSILTVIITMIVTVLLKAFWDWATNRSGKEALKELRAEFQGFKTQFIQDLNELKLKDTTFKAELVKDSNELKSEDLVFKNKLLQDLNELKYKYTGREIYDGHLNVCTLRLQEYKDCIHDLKQEIAIQKEFVQSLTQRITNLETRN